MDLPISFSAQATATNLQNSEVNPNMLYESQKHIVWLVTYKGEIDRKRRVAYTTGFVVGDGLLLSCAHDETDEWHDLEIKCRPLGMADFTYEAEVAYVRHDYGLRLLKMLGTRFSDYAKFGSGNLAVGDQVMMIGNPNMCVGLGVLGNVLYPCSEHADWNESEELMCRSYVSNFLSETPPYLTLGHIWNKKEFYEHEVPSRPLTYEKGYLANIPVVMCSFASNSGALGSPIFNLNGEVVGLFVQSGIEPYEHAISIHVSAIKKFLLLAKGETFRG